MSPDGKRMVFGGRARFTPVTPAVSAPILHRFMTDRFPQLKGIRVTHAWTGNVAFTWDALPHTGVMDGMHYALGCNGSGVAMMTYLGHQTARRIVGGANSTCGFELAEFPDFPLYNGSPNWALPAIGAYYRFRDGLSRALARLRVSWNRRLGESARRCWLSASRKTYWPQLFALDLPLLKVSQYELEVGSAVRHLGRHDRLVTELGTSRHLADVRFGITLTCWGPVRRVPTSSAARLQEFKCRQ